MQNTLPPRIGDLVRRGKDWQERYGDEDASSWGAVVAVEEYTVGVKWQNNQLSRRYRYGMNKKYDVEIVGRRGPGREFDIGDAVYLNNNRVAIIRYIGITHFCIDEDLYGVEVKVTESGYPKGEHSGTIEGVEYFQSAPGSGLFISRKDIKCKLHPEQLVLLCIRDTKLAPKEFLPKGLPKSSRPAPPPPAPRSAALSMSFNQQPEAPKKIAGAGLDFTRKPAKSMPCPPPPDRKPPPVPIKSKKQRLASYSTEPLPSSGKKIELSAPVVLAESQSAPNTPPSESNFLPSSKSAADVGMEEDVAGVVFPNKVQFPETKSTSEIVTVSAPDIIELAPTSSSERRETNVRFSIDPRAKKITKTRLQKRKRTLEKTNSEWKVKWVGGREVWENNVTGEIDYIPQNLFMSSAMLDLANEVDDERLEDLAEMWTCIQCSHKNSIQIPVCEACNSLPPMASKTPNVSSVWRCPRCDWENSNDSPVCLQCRSLPPLDHDSTKALHEDIRERLGSGDYRRQPSATFSPSDFPLGTSLLESPRRGMQADSIASDERGGCEIPVMMLDGIERKVSARLDIRKESLSHPTDILQTRRRSAATNTPSVGSPSPLAVGSPVNEHVVGELGEPVELKFGGGWRNGIISKVDDPFLIVEYVYENEKQEKKFALKQLGTELLKKKLRPVQATMDMRESAMKDMTEKEKIQQKLNMILEANKVCADCTSEKPNWASLNIGVVICSNCAGVHRNLGVHISQVRSLTLDEWTMDMVNGIKVNTKINSILEFNVPPKGYMKPHATSKREVFEKYINAKYVQKIFEKRPGIGANPPKYDSGDRRIESSASADVGMIEYNGVCMIHIRQCSNLPNADYFSESDPYVIVTNGDFQKARTKHIQNNNSPVFNELVNLTVQEKVPIKVFVFHKKRFLQDVVLAEGQILLDPSEAESYDVELVLNPGSAFRTHSKEIKISLGITYTKLS